MDEPISLADALLYLRIDGSDEDSLIEGLIVAAREQVESFTGLILTRRTVMETRSAFGPWIDLYSWPIASIDSVQYLDNAYTTQTLSADGWIAATGMRPVRLAARGYWPATAAARGAVTITLTAGYATPEDVPQALKQAMLLLVGHSYGAREDAGETPAAIGALLRPHRVMSV